MEWPHYPWMDLTAEAILNGWHERIARVETEESANLARLPFVRGVAIIGGVGRGSPWPLSDIDMLVAGDMWHSRDPEDLVRDEEVRRNQRLLRNGVPNEIESSEWVVLSEDVRGAAHEGDDALFARLAHPHWLGIVIKAQRCRVSQDFEGTMQKFLGRCDEVFDSDRFVALWLGRVISGCTRQLEKAATRLREGDPKGSSLEVLRATYQQLPAGAYAVWRKVPQSSARSVTRFLTAAREAGDHVKEELYLTSCRLEEATAWERIATAPLEGEHMRDLMWAIREGAGERLDELAVTRDVLNLSLWRTVITDMSDEPRPPWTGVTDERGEAQRQLDAAWALLERLIVELQGIRAGQLRAAPEPSSADRRDSAS